MICQTKAQHYAMHNCMTLGVIKYLSSRPTLFAYPCKHINILADNMDHNLYRKIFNLFNFALYQFNHVSFQRQIRIHNIYQQFRA